MVLCLTLLRESHAARLMMLNSAPLSGYLDTMLGISHTRVLVSNRVLYVLFFKPQKPHYEMV